MFMIKITNNNDIMTTIVTPILITMMIQMLTERFV